MQPSVKNACIFFFFVCIFTQLDSTELKNLAVLRIRRGASNLHGFVIFYSEILFDLTNKLAFWTKIENLSLVTLSSLSRHNNNETTVLLLVLWYCFPLKWGITSCQRQKWILEYKKIKIMSIMRFNNLGSFY